MKYKEIVKAHKIIRALNHPLRKVILTTIRDEKSIRVRDLVLKLRKESSVISQQLRILREAGVVSYIKKGKEHHYIIDKENKDRIEAGIKTIINE